jgi:hypothetical protein
MLFLMGMTILFLMIFYPLQGYAAEKSPKFMIFAHELMEGTFKEAYPEIEELYESDNQLVLITYDRVLKSGTHLVKVQIENAIGERIYDESKEVMVQNEKPGPCIYYTAPFDEAFKAKLMPVFVTIRFSLDGKSYEPRQIKYSAQNAMKKNASQVIVLPFYSSTNTLFDYSLKEEILNTFAGAIGHEIKRAFPKMISSDMVKAKRLDLKSKGCFKHPPCHKQLQEAFGEGIFLTGDVNIPNTTGWLTTPKFAKLEIYVFNARTGDEREFKSDYIINGPGEKGADSMKKLIIDAFHREGLLLYMRALL